MTRDPVCGMQLDEDEAAESTEYQGKEYFFCSEECKEQFEENPSRYTQEKTGGATI